MSIGLFRYFGLSWWSVFDAALALGSLGLIASGSSGFVKCQRRVRALDGLLGTDPGLTDLETG